jgi:carbon monoxide dehydrogenase subunit G
MKITGEHQFSHSSDEVWKALLDPVALAATLPGARRLEPTGEDAYAISVDVGVGSVKGTYEGTFALADQEPPRACTVEANASGRPGSVSVVARMRMADDEHEDAVLTYEADATVTGPLAGVGQRLMGAAARRTTAQFLTALDEYIRSPGGEEAAEPQVGHAIEPAGGLRGGSDAKVVVASALGGFLLALVGVAVGRWSSRR